MADTPSAPQRPSERVVHGERLVDDYAWLRDEHWREVMRDPARLAPDIRAYLEAENRQADAYFADAAELRRTLVAEMRGRIKEDDSSVPMRDGVFAYYVRYREGGQHPLHCRVPSAGGNEQLLLDGDTLAKGHAYYLLGGARHSRDHRRLAWSADDAGSEYFAIRVRDLASGADLSDLVPDSTGGAVWTADGSAFYYVRLDAEHRPSRVFRHRIGTPASDDVVVYEEHDPGFFVGVSELQAGAFAAISVSASETTENHLLDLADPAAKPRLIAPRQTGERYHVEHHPALGGSDTLVILTNADGAEDFKIMTAPLATPGREHWRELVAHRPGTIILDLGVLRDWMVRLERHEGLPRVVVRRLTPHLSPAGRGRPSEARSGEGDRASMETATPSPGSALRASPTSPQRGEVEEDDGAEHTIAFDEEAYALGMEIGFEFVTDTLRFGYASMTTPNETWDYDMRARTRVLKKRQEVPSGHDPARFVTRRIFAPAADGETVPVSLLHRRDVDTKQAPCLLYGYGAYGFAIPASFNTNRLSLVERGFVVAIAHVRGGTDKGWRWYREGKLAHKQNTFTDFIAAAEHLVRAGFAAKGRVIAQGGSAGGLLMGAVANMRPDLFAGVVAEVPFVDALNTMLDDTLPLTPPEWPEWGNPITDAEAFRRIRSYSPYDNVRAQAYPAMLVLAGLSDPRVTYWEPAKWVAKLRALKTDNNPLALRTNMDAGHAGAAGRFERLEEVALVYAFALKTVGLA